MLSEYIKGFNIIIEQLNIIIEQNRTMIDKMDVWKDAAIKALEGSKQDAD